MSDLDDLMSEGMIISEEVMGAERFYIAGLPYVGILNEFSGEQEIELGGILSSYHATLVCQRPQFRAFGSPLHQTLQGKIVEIEGVKYTVQRVIIK
jgi:hypothetical protein